jgi:DNA-binding transcriptional LysR family regulator
MARDRPKLFQLQALIAVADGGSFSEAALQLNMSQSAVSYAIAALESDLGVVLLARGRFGATLTPIGEQVVQRARQVVYLLDDIVKQASLARGLDGGYVRVASFRSAATHILPSVVAQFCRQFPAIAITIADYDDRPDVEDDLRKGRVDLGITYLPTSREFETWDLLQDEFVVLLPPQPQPNPTPLTWADLQHHPLIMAPDGDGCDAMVYAHCAQHGVALKASYRIRSDVAIVNMVAQGVGAAIAPRLATEPIPSGVQVCSLPVPLFRTISVAMLHNALLPPAAYAFLDLLKTIPLPPHCAAIPRSSLA